MKSGATDHPHTAGKSPGDFHRAVFELRLGAGLSLRTFCSAFELRDNFQPRFCTEPADGPERYIEFLWRSDTDHTLRFIAPAIEELALITEYRFHVFSFG